MGDVSNELMYELLKRMNDRFDKLDKTVSEVKGELIAMRGTMVAMQADTGNIYSMLYRQDDRLDRIEKRLDLRELAEKGAPYLPE